MPTRTGGMGPVGPASGKPPVAGPSRDSWPGRPEQGPAVSGMVGAASFSPLSNPPTAALQFLKTPLCCV